MKSTKLDKLAATIVAAAKSWADELEAHLRDTEAQSMKTVDQELAKGGMRVVCVSYGQEPCVEFGLFFPATCAIRGVANTDLKGNTTTPADLAITRQ